MVELLPSASTKRWLRPCEFSAIMSGSMRWIVNENAASSAPSHCYRKSGSGLLDGSYPTRDRPPLPVSSVITPISSARISMPLPYLAFCSRPLLFPFGSTRFDHASFSRHETLGRLLHHARVINSSLGMRQLYFGTRSNENGCRNFISLFLEGAARN